MKKYLFLVMVSVTTLSFLGCENTNNNFTGTAGEVKLLTLDPGHFHAALVQKTMYEQVSPVVHVYAPQGSDVQDVAVGWFPSGDAQSVNPRISHAADSSPLRRAVAKRVMSRMAFSRR